jgi:hypothetical protein
VTQIKTVYVLVSPVERNYTERKCTTVTEWKEETTGTDEMRITAMLGVTPVIPTIKKHTKESIRCIWSPSTD